MDEDRLTQISARWWALHQAREALRAAPTVETYAQLGAALRDFERHAEDDVAYLLDRIDPLRSSSNAQWPGLIEPQTDDERSLAMEIVFGVAPTLPVIVTRAMVSVAIKALRRVPR